MRQAIIAGFAMASPALVAWIIALVLGLIMLKRQGGKAERFLVAGVSIMLVSTLIDASTEGFTQWLYRNTEIANFGRTVSLIIWAQSLVSLTGIVCLVYAFWTKFKATSAKVTPTKVTPDA